MFRIKSVVNHQDVNIWGSEPLDELKHVITNNAVVIEWYAFTKERAKFPYISNEDVTGESFRNRLVCNAFLPSSFL